MRRALISCDNSGRFLFGLLLSQELEAMLHDGRAATPKINLPASIKILLHEVRVVQANLGSQLDRLEQIERDLLVLAGNCSFGINSLVTASSPAVAHNIETRELPDGSVDIVIDRGRKFRLASRLAEVFQFIASGTKERSGNDSLVGWRTREQILKLVQESAEREFDRRYVNNLVHLLKKALRRAGYNQNLIQTHRRKGVRIAYKRGAQSVDKASSRA